MNHLHLDSVTARLESLEETIITKLIDRAQFRLNKQVYSPGKSGFAHNTTDSLLDIRLRYQEAMDADFGRYCIAEERPFHDDLPGPKRVVTTSDPDLRIHDYNKVNLSKDIRRHYDSLVPRICRDGDDEEYGSSVEHDVYAFQAIARRIHFGAFYVGECKYRFAPHVYAPHVHAGDEETLMRLLTRDDVEKRILQRICDKVEILQRCANQALRTLIDPGVIRSFFESVVIPLTKRGEILYLLNRTVE